MAVIAITGDHLIAVEHRHLHADDDCFLANVEVTEAANQAHAVHLSGFFLEPADQQHLPQRVKLLFLREIGDQVLLRPVDGPEVLDALFGCSGYGNGHRVPRRISGG